MSSGEVWATFTEVGWHCWPNAHDERSYLRDLHRHLFHVTVTVPVTHDERDVEFHDLQELARGAWTGPQLGAKSCETIARQVGAEVLAATKVDQVRVTVSEDGECGATLTIEREQQ